MNNSNIDLGFIPVGVPGTSGSGSTHTSALLIKQIADIHDLTVYVLAKNQEKIDELPRSEIVDYEIIRFRNKLPHTHHNRRRALSQIVQRLEEHDLIHSYSTGFIPELSELNVPTLVTLNSYLPVCPKDSLMYHDGSICDGPELSKCSSCIARSQDYIQSTKSSFEHLYYQFGSLLYVRNSLNTNQNINAFHALAPHLREVYEQIGFDRNKITTVPHYYDNRFECENNTLNDPIELLYVGKLTKKKGVDIIPKSLAKASFDFELKIAGEGSEREQMMDAFKRYGIDDKVQFLGFVDYENVPAVYESADIFLYPGRWAEPFGRVFLEAMTSRTPVVATDVGSAEYILGDAGIVYSNEDYERKLTEGITKIASSYSEYVDACGDELKRFKLDTVIEQFNDLYANVVEME